MIRIGLTDNSGHLNHNSVREYDPQLQPTISSSISAYAKDCGLGSLPRRAALAVSGLPRGETISITNSRWILSRSGLTAMFGAEPLIINDFAANAWAIGSSRSAGRIGAFGRRTVQPDKPGTYCIIGMGSGLGVAALTRDRHGFVHVVPTEAGHMAMMDGLPIGPAVLNQLREKGTPSGEMLLSGPGLLRIHSAVRSVVGGGREYSSSREMLNPAAQKADPTIKEALNVFATAFWYFAGNVVLAYGAWDGLILTGSIAAQTRAVLEQSDVRRHFFINGPYARRLAEVPVGTASYRDAELEGAAVALLVDEVHKAFKDPASAELADYRKASVSTLISPQAQNDTWSNATAPGGASWHQSRRPACA
jgi:glucokinase